MQLLLRQCLLFYVGLFLSTCSLHRFALQSDPIQCLVILHSVSLHVGSMAQNRKQPRHCRQVVRLIPAALAIPVASLSPWLRGSSINFLATVVRFTPLRLAAANAAAWLRGYRRHGLQAVQRGRHR